MSQYLLSVHMVEGHNPYADEAEMQEAFAAVEAFNADLQDQGAWVFAGGLQPADVATVVDATGADTLTTDGPFSEAKEHIGGVWVIEVADLDAALAWAAKGSSACKNPVEVRPFQGEPED